MENLKWDYNQNLERYYRGCEYLEQHRDEIDKYLPELNKISNNLNLILEQIMKYEHVTDDEIINGFTLEE